MYFSLQLVEFLTIPGDFRWKQVMSEMVNFTSYRLKRRTLQKKHAKNILGSTQSMTSPLQKRLVPNFSTLTVNLWGQKGLTDSSSSYLSLLEE